jgi:hypothetical protein
MQFLSRFRRRKTNFTKNLAIVSGIVLVWRGIWYMLDFLDKWLFGDSHFGTAVAGVLIGLGIIYLYDRELSAIEKL